MNKQRLLFFGDFIIILASALVSVDGLFCSFVNTKRIKNFKNKRSYFIGLRGRKYGKLELNNK